ncbi:hypothetical protein AV530_000593 [Patagioenas fasciata monilis]|uniref:Uncharacterized protein n=1 Tax=Patagioenas fasciata monilis TaxID=372326 RepID=A0A1V4IG82_PATFA|nr:hypothetical protein AV530_000593 [Patagioenas fasciata monilis]
MVSSDTATAVTRPPAWSRTRHEHCPGKAVKADRCIAVGFSPLWCCSVSVVPSGDEVTTAVPPWGDDSLGEVQCAVNGWSLQTAAGFCCRAKQLELATSLVLSEDTDASTELFAVWNSIALMTLVSVTSSLKCSGLQQAKCSLQEDTSPESSKRRKLSLCANSPAVSASLCLGLMSQPETGEACAALPSHPASSCFQKPSQLLGRPPRTLRRKRRDGSSECQHFGAKQQCCEHVFKLDHADEL